MSYQVLARKYRPQKFSDVIGQDHVTRTLKNAIEQQRIAHGYIFSGHRGIGKTTIARILAMALNCRKNDAPTAAPCGVCESCTEVRAGNAVDVIEIDAATNRGIDEIRELREGARYRPARDRYKVYILDEAHQITDAAFNALLKTLEEPPGHIVFMMATTQPEDIPQTIRSRCQHFSFHAVKFEDIVGQLKDIAKQEKITIEDDAVAILAEAGDGSMRDALSIMDQAIAGGGAAITVAQVRGLVGTVSTEILESIMNAVGRDSSQEVLQILDKLVSEGQSPSHFVKQLVRFLRNAVVAKVAGKDSSLLQISSDERTRVFRLAEQFSEEDLARFLQIALRTHDDLGYKHEQRFHLELGLLKMVHAQRLLPIEQLLSQQPAPQQVAPTLRTGAAPSSPSARSVEAARSAAPAVSPFEADRARKGRSGPEMSGGLGTSSAVAENSNKNVIAAATAVAAAVVAEVQARVAVPTPAPTPAPTNGDLDALRGAVIAELEASNQGMLAGMLDAGEWSLAGNEITIRVAASAVMIEMSFGTEPKKMVTAAASRAAGRPLKMTVMTGGSANAMPSHRGTARASGSSGASARMRASEDPIVQYMQDKFGAEIRTVVDHKDKA
ncbi:MAG TPA: DNA polymerase III subunit gamma/tau [Terriglobales bacterium]|nr:DNA polymerase III subunit gamma/tau [Terriglobales bacterium]